jgi:hypothetical protein
MPLRPLPPTRYELQLLRQRVYLGNRGGGSRYFTQVEQDNHPAEPGDEFDWDRLTVGEPVMFTAVFDPYDGIWRVTNEAIVTSPQDLGSPGWSIRRVGGGAPLMVGWVGHPLKAGETFVLRVSGVWVTSFTAP